MQTDTERYRQTERQRQKPRQIEIESLHSVYKGSLISAEVPPITLHFTFLISLLLFSVFLADRQTMLSIQNFLAVSALSLLVSSVLARSIKDESDQKEAELLSGVAGPYTDARILADLFDYFRAYRHVMKGDQPEYGLEATQKRSWPGYGKFVVPTSMKRKMFWTPLGHLPASARLGRPQALRPHMDDGTGSPVFRYG